jgi:hypothetical protein
MAIARETTQTQIVQLVAAPGTPWPDVIHLKCNSHHLLRAQAIGTPSLRGIDDSLTERLRNTGHASSLEQAQRVVGFRFHQGNAVAFCE